MNKLFLIESAFVLLCFWVGYYFIFRNMKWPMLNRILLLSGITFSILVPFLNIDGLFPAVRERLPAIPAIIVNEFNSPSKLFKQEQISAFDIDLFSAIYLTITILLLIRLIIKVVRILRLIKKSHFISLGKLKICRSTDQSEIFSFFHYIFIYADYSDKEFDYVLQHERAHAHQWHSVDILLIELYTAICWINPLSWFYKRCIQETHEFLADAAVVDGLAPREKTDYKMMILKSQVSNQYSYIINAFNFLSYKKRINMINQTKIALKAKIGYFGAIGVILVLITFGKVLSHPSSSVGTLYDTLDRKPLYKEGTENLYRYLYKNIRYPSIARESRAEGTFIVTFLVDASGKVKESKIVDKVPSSVIMLNEVVVVGYNKGESRTNELEAGKKAIESEGIRLVSLLGDFNPGIKNGSPVNVQMAVPLKFRIEIKN